MVPELRSSSDLCDEALAMLHRRDYAAVAGMLERKAAAAFFAKEYGGKIVSQMYNTMRADGQLFDHGHQLSGDQLKILAYARKHGAPVGEEDITVHFDYVARIERAGGECGEYAVEFPDLTSLLIFASGYPALKQAKEEAKSCLAFYLRHNMSIGKTIPKPKYHGRKTARVRPFKVQLTLNDLIFED